MKQIFFLPFTRNWNGDGLTATLETLVSTAMENAFVRNHHSIAFPAIGCGQFFCSVTTVAEAMVKAAYEQSNKYKLSVIFVIEPNRMDVYEEFLKQVAFVTPAVPHYFPKIVASLTVENSCIEIISGDLTQENVTHLFP